jgi:TetR/AcrR family transcriptional regulator, copper-responsive repressor
MEKVAAQKVPRGRPRQFDRDAALERAMRLFWARGYEATSINDLTAAMGIMPPSLYSAFGDKKRLFLEAVDLYQAGPGNFARRALAEEPTAERAIRRLLLDGVASFCDPSQPAGCMVVLSATNCGVEAADILAELAERRTVGEQCIRDRIAKGVAAGELVDGANIDALTGLVTATFFGLSIKARDGANRDALESIVEQVMACWPRAVASV